MSDDPRTPQQTSKPGLMMLGTTNPNNPNNPNPNAKRAKSRTDAGRNIITGKQSSKQQSNPIISGTLDSKKSRNNRKSGNPGNDPTPNSNNRTTNKRGGSCGSMEELFHFTFLSIALGFLLVFLREVTIPFVVALFLMYLFRPFADNVESFFTQSKYCCCKDRGTRDEENGLLASGDTDEDDMYNEDEDSDGSGMFHCSKQCSGYAGRVVGTAMSVMLSLLFMGGVAVVIARSLQELESGGKLDAYRKQYSLLENRTAAYFTEQFHIDGNKFVTQVWGSDNALGNISVALLNFMTNFASALLLVLVFLTFMLVDDQYNGGPRSRWERAENKSRAKKFQAEDDDATEEESCSKRLQYILCCCTSFNQKEEEENHNPKLKIGIRQAINRSIMQYIVLKTKICIFSSILVFIVLMALQIPLAGLIALVSFVLNYIPNFGPAVATFLPIPVVLLDSSLTSAQGVLAVLLPALVHGLVGNLLEPVLFSKNKEIDLHPVVLIGCIVFWYILWGVPGAILAVPLTTTIKIISEKIEEGNRQGDGEDGKGAWALKELLNGRIPFDDDQEI